MIKGWIMIIELCFYNNIRRRSQPEEMLEKWKETAYLSFTSRYQSLMDIKVYNFYRYKSMAIRHYDHYGGCCQIRSGHGDIRQQDGKLHDCAWILEE
jgi:hypothetical protein